MSTIYDKFDGVFGIFLLPLFVFPAGSSVILNLRNKRGWVEEVVDRDVFA